MKDQNIYRSFRFAIALGLVAPATMFACAADTTGVEDESEVYESSVEMAPDFDDAADSLSRPTIQGTLADGIGSIGSFARNRKFIGFNVQAEEGSTLQFNLNRPVVTFGALMGPQTGYRLALYRQGTNGLPRGRALAVGTSNDGGRNVALTYESTRTEALVIVAYRLSSGSAQGDFQINLTVGGGERRCGGESDLSCSRNEFCNYAAEAICGAADQTGTCEAKPQVCTFEYSPVCGCDGQTYGNECEANSAGISVARIGACNPPPLGRTCGGFAGLQCGDGQYCKYEPSAMCGAADQTGTCQAKPDACAQVHQPVCGCDGRTYSNACHAAIAGVSVTDSFANCAR